MLELINIHCGYDRVPAVHGIDLTVEDGEIVALIGANGAGKTTTAKAICGLVPVMNGRINYQGNRIDGLEPHEIVERGVIQVPENRELFGSMSIRENLLVGAQTPSGKRNREANMDRVVELFPRLAERSGQRVDQLSGGEQQMLTLARALMGDPDLLVLDEPSIGLAPHLVSEVFTVIEEIHEETGLTVLVIEQNVRQCLELADRGYVMENGRIRLEGNSDTLLNDQQVKEAYLGI